MILNLKEIDHWVFDLDNTLYPAKNNLFAQVDRRMGQFISQEFKLSFDEAKVLQKHYFRTYGTTLRGLMTEHDIRPEDFLSFVHDIDFGVLQVDHQLNDALGQLKGRKIIYTNASQDYAQKVMEKLELQDHFSDIFDIKSADYMPKPTKVSYQKMVDELKLNPSRSVMVEDIARNLVPASEMGMKTVWVKTDQHWSGDGRQDKYIDHTVTDLANWLESHVYET